MEIDAQILASGLHCDWSESANWDSVMDLKDCKC